MGIINTNVFIRKVYNPNLDRIDLYCQQGAIKYRFPFLTRSQLVLKKRELRSQGICDFTVVKLSPREIGRRLYGMRKKHGNSKKL
jgi:tetrahydromethanopterin S-methyltransferase subunit F